MTFLRSSFVVLAFSCLAFAAESPVFQAVCDDFRTVALVESDFTEEKTLKILSHPLRSKGTVMFSPERGVYRVMQDPVQQELLITRSHLTQKDANGKIRKMSVRSQPAAQVFVDVFLSFFAGDRRAWEKNFAASFQGTEDNWEIELTPLEKSPAAKALKNIVIEGRNGILDTMTLTETNGDQTRTVYRNQQVFGKDDSSVMERFPTELKAP